MKMPENQPSPANTNVETHEDAERPLRLDRQALRLDPPVVRFEEDRSAGGPTR